MLYNKEQIKEIIPHRDPFLLIDEVESMEEGKEIVAIKHVDPSEYYFEGHFPQEKVMPGVLIIEALAQAGAVAILSMEQNRGKIAYFGCSKEAKFRTKVVPGDTLRLEVKIDRLRSSAGTGIGVAMVGDKVACQCHLMFAIG